MENFEEINKLAKELYNYLQPYCISIYLGGSHCLDFIKNPHDIDLILFSDQPVDMCHIRRLLYFYQQKHELDKLIDLFQVRNKQNEELAYGSYIHKDMILLVGEKIEFKFDPLNKHKKEYISILLKTINYLKVGKIKNQKRWYQIFRGYFLLKNNSYDLTEKQKEIINAAHDKTKDFKKLKEEVERWLISQT